MIINADTTSCDGSGTLCGNPIGMLSTCGGVEMASQRQMLKQVKEAYKA